MESGHDRARECRTTASTGETRRVSRRVAGHGPRGTHARQLLVEVPLKLVRELSVLIAGAVVRAAVGRDCCMVLALLEAMRRGSTY